MPPLACVMCDSLVCPYGLAQGLAQSNCSLNLDKLSYIHVQFLPEIYFFFFFNIPFPTNEM